MLGWMLIFALMLLCGAIAAVGDVGPVPGMTSSLVFGFPAGSFGADAVAAGQGISRRWAGRRESFLVFMRVKTNMRNKPGAQFVPHRAGAVFPFAR